VRDINIPNDDAEGVPLPCVLNFHITRERGPGGYSLICKRLVDVDDGNTCGFERHIVQHEFLTVAEPQNGRDGDGIGPTSFRR
jgi:hypothetical protein